MCAYDNSDFPQLRDIEARTETKLLKLGIFIKKQAFHFILFFQISRVRCKTIWKTLRNGSPVSRSFRICNSIVWYKTRAVKSPEIILRV